MGRFASRWSFALTACAFALLATSCGDIDYNPKGDPALGVGKLEVGMNERRLVRELGRGTPAQWIDERGQHVNVLLYRNGPSVLATVVDTRDVVALEFFEHMAASDVHNEFSLSQASQPYVTSVPIAPMLWLDRPVFSDALPTTPPGWSIPTDFTSGQTAKSVYFTRDAHSVSKDRSRGYGWIVRLR